MADLCGYVQINAESLLKQIQEAMMELLEEGTETLLKLMRQEIQRTMHGGAPGKPEWRDELASELREVYRVAANEAIEFGVGLPYTSYADAGHRFVRAMLVAYGSGSEAGGSAIRSRPGELVWDDDLHDYKPSAALTAYDLPDAFNQEGNDFINNAMKLMQVHFRQLLAQAGARLPKGLFAGLTHAVRR